MQELLGDLATALGDAGAALADLAAEFGVLAAYALGSGALTLFGLSVEYRSLQRLLGGETVLGAWLAYMGTLVLAVGLLLARRKVLPRVAAARSE